MVLSCLMLFAASFLAATILPFSSEVILFALLREGYPPFVLLATATLGNTLGSFANYGLGRWLLHYRDRRWFYFSGEQIDKGQRWFQHYGFWVLLLAWLPVVGDALTLVAGVMKVRVWLFLLLVAIGKGLRYLTILGLSSWWPL
ncbi:YqaA family protein [Desulfuromonas sp. AOP6]|uniref:YqaA family protein n=1 Tax=Desulfuromonas sp. AOP6 TaxID=1566351 RepID=UPI00127FB73A|nr:YqaA family protein [Desulfuromonas sp. AOP6]BCA81170.1 hypothetical protein AOP6_2957 [Desulfuromonas sp. AOP6]